MTDMARLFLLLGIAGAAVTFLGSLAIWFLDEPRRIRRALRRVLGGEPESMVLARGRGRGAGFSFQTGLAAVAWDRGAWCLIYRLDELIGAELMVDGQVAARVFRGEPRRALDQRVSSADQITLRLIFDDPRNPDFDLDLWLRGDEARRDDWSPRLAIQEANSWLARCDAILRRPLAPRPAPIVAAPTPPSAKAAERDDDPPWDEDDVEDADDLPPRLL
jgi:hypothetical protein